MPSWTEAYVPHGEGCAACPEDLWEYRDSSLHALHSVRLEADFKDVFHALHNAIDLRSQIIEDVWQCRPLQSSPSISTPSILSTCDPTWRPLIRPVARRKAAPPSLGGYGEVSGRSRRSRVSFQERIQVHLWDHYTDRTPTIEVQSVDLHDLLQKYAHSSSSTWRVAASHVKDTSPFSTHCEAADDRHGDFVHSPLAAGIPPSLLRLQHDLLA